MDIDYSSYTVFYPLSPNSNNDSIWYLACLHVVEGEITEELEFYINPESGFSPFYSLGTNISPALLKEKPTFDQIWEKIKHYFTNHIIVVHNASYVFKLLYTVLDKYNIEKPEINFYCTLFLSKKYLFNNIVFSRMDLNLARLCTCFALPFENQKNSIEKAKECDALFSKLFEKYDFDIEENLLLYSENDPRLSKDNDFCGTFLEQREQVFSGMLNNIPNVSIKLSQDKLKRHSLEELGDITFSNFTKKTPVSKISSFIVIDTETTGLSVRNEIIEIAAVKFVDFQPVEQFSILIKPKKEIPYEITSINNITNEMVQNQPYIHEVIPAFQNYINGYNLVGHNLMFDLRMLHVNGCTFPLKGIKYFDTMLLAQKTLKRPKYKYDRDLESYEINNNIDYDVLNYKLDTLCDYYDIANVKAHRATSDCLATGLIFREIFMSKCVD